MFQRVMPTILKELASAEATNRRNAAFCVGEMCKNGGESTLKYPSSHVASCSSPFPLTHPLGSCKILFNLGSLGFNWIGGGCS